MSRRQGDADLGSLELLLDTICNTFGGVIFIAILVVVLLQMTRKKQPTVPDAPTHSKLVQSEVALEQARADLEILKQVAATQDQLLGPYSDPDLADQARRVKEAGKALDDLAAQRNEMLETAARQQIEINNIALQSAAVTQDREKAKSQLALLLEQLAKEKAARSQTAKLPRLHRTNKNEAPMFFIGGRLYFYYTRGADGRYSFNGTDCEGRNGGKLIVPRVGNGVAVNETNRSLLEQRLKQFDPKAHYPAIFVWPDSFESFSLLRESLVRLGFEYRLVPLPANQEGVTVNADGPASDFVM